MNRRLAIIAVAAFLPLSACGGSGGSGSTGTSGPAGSAASSGSGSTSTAPGGGMSAGDVDAKPGAVLTIAPEGGKGSVKIVGLEWAPKMKGTGITATKGAFLALKVTVSADEGSVDAGTAAFVVDDGATEKTVGMPNAAGNWQPAIQGQATPGKPVTGWVVFDTKKAKQRITWGSAFADPTTLPAFTVTP